MSAPPFHVFAPAKINLFLHITGRRDDGYHTLQSLMVFADIGDDLEFAGHTDFIVDVKGPFAAALPDSKDNLIFKAAQMLSTDYKVPLRGKITLTKNMPIASGIGGGSADAAAALKGLVKLWSLPGDRARLQKIALQLGADVPACLEGHSSLAEGIGEKLASVPEMPPLHLVLVNPRIATSTPAVFKNFCGDFSAPVSFNADYLKEYRNDLTQAAIIVTPAISTVLAALANTKQCLFHRLSGSGATCFGVYEDKAAAEAAAAALTMQHPGWWIVSTTVN